jgi:hypothetical protein
VHLIEVQLLIEIVETADDIGYSESQEISGVDHELGVCELLLVFLRPDAHLVIQDGTSDLVAIPSLADSFVDQEVVIQVCAHFFPPKGLF